MDVGDRVKAGQLLAVLEIPELRDEARQVFPRTEVPRDFDAIEIPLPERGAPQLVRFGEAPAPSEVT